MITMSAISKFDYRAPETLGEVLVSLSKNQNGGTRILAGGTDLILQMKYGLARPLAVLDIKRIPELNLLHWEESGGLRFGAALPISRLLAFSPLVQNYDLLAQACSLIGSIQIKNRATVGGNISNAAPSADSAPALLCLDAKVRLDCAEGSRTLPIAEFFLAPGKTTLSANEILVEIALPRPPANSAGFYLRHTTREEMDIAVVGVGAFLAIAPQTRQVQTVRLSLGAVAPTPLRAHAAEAVLAGQVITTDLIEKAAATAAGEAKPITDIRGSADFRRELVQVLTRRVLRQCCRKLETMV